MRNAKNYFNPRFFSPFACSIFLKFIKFNGDVAFKMYNSGDVVEYEAQNFRIFLPAKILDGYRFGKIAGQEKKIIAQFFLPEEEFIRLIHMLGGSAKKVSQPPSSPTLGDLLKL